MIRSGMCFGQPCLIVGGGPSLRRFAWRRLKKWGGYIIACNSSYRDIPRTPDLIISRDKRWMDRNHEAIKGIKCAKVYHENEKATYPGVANFGPCEGWSQHLSTGFVCTGTHADSTGISALNLADILGASPIYLLGFDLKGDGGMTSNYHNYYPARWARTELNVYGPMLGLFRHHRWSPRGRVINLNPDGRLADVFETRPWEEVIL